MSLIVLNCFVLGDDPDRAFTVKIPKKESVDILKDRIKEKKISHFNHSDASDLGLWQVSFPIKYLKMELENIDLARYQKLSPSNKKLATFFTNVVDDCLHVIVKAPGTYL